MVKKKTFLRLWIKKKKREIAKYFFFAKKRPFPLFTQFSLRVVVVLMEPETLYNSLRIIVRRSLLIDQVQH